MQTHRNVLFDMQRQCHDLGTALDDRFGMLFHPSSSASVCHLFGALLAGATVCPFDLRADGLGGLARWLRDERISVLDINVATFRALSAMLPEGTTFPDMRIFAPGGEPVHRRDVEAFRRYFCPGCVLQNALGTTETRTVTHVYLDHDSEFEGERVPVGFAVREKAVRLIGPDDADVRPGETGEIVVESHYLSPGYWKRPDLTEAAFETLPAGRRYRTGDLGVRDADGCITHLGRKDFQVKIRGHRVEVLEVETSVRALAGITEAVVVARPDARGEAQLVAFVVPERTRESRPSVGAWRQALGERLPAHMVPGRFQILQALPLTLNGKLNRRDLIERSLPADPSHVATAPTTPAERRLAAVWCNVLGLKAVDLHAHFFDDLGGHSLLAATLAIQIEADLGRPLRIIDVYDHPTVARLAAFLATAPPRPSEAGATPLRSFSGVPASAPRFFCVPGIGGSALGFAPLAERLRPHASVLAFDYEEPPRRAPLREVSVESLAEAFVASIRAEQPTGPYVLGGFSLGGAIAFEAAQQLREVDETVSLLVLLDTGLSERPSLERPGAFMRHARRAGVAGFPRHVARWLLYRVRRWQRLRAGRDGAPLTGRREVREAVLWRALRTYRPTLYSGPVLLLRSMTAGRTKPTEWSSLCPQLETHVVGERHMIIEEPEVDVVAAHLAPRFSGVLHLGSDRSNA